MKMKEESEKVGLKLNIQKTKIMASGPITSWQMDGETMETVRDFLFGGCSKITAGGDCSHEIKRCLFLGKKSMINLDSILKVRDITLPTKVCIAKAMVFPVVVWMWELYHKEGWELKNWCFWIVVLEKTPEHPLNWKIKPAKLLQSCPTLCHPRDSSPPGSPVPGILQARTLEWVAISFSNAWKWKVKVKSLSCVWLLTTPWTAAHQAPPSMGFARQE